MKSKLIILTAVLLQYFTVNAQEYKISNDRIYFEYGPESFKLSDEVFNKKDKSKIRFNFWIRDFTDTINTLLAIRQDKQGQWHGKRIDFFSWDWKSYKNLKETNIIFDNQWDTLWKTLLVHNFLSLDTFEKARLKWHRQPGDVVLSLDGKEYCVEIFVTNKKHEYKYVNPEQLTESYYKNKNVDDIIFICNSLKSYFKLRTGLK